ncbi:MAG TPA: hypothetical protein VI356_13430 [Myxococcales bacterium]
MRSVALFVVPAALALLFALTFALARDSIPGWGDDPLFNLWTFELVWHHLDGEGVRALFSGRLWWAPLYGGHPLGLAFSENQIVPALLLWPLRKICGNGALSLNAGAVLWILAAFAAAAGWLRSIGHRALACWGGLLFAASGWLQSQYAHYQNLYVFVLPLSLWAWSRFRERPRALTLLACALSFGWIGGWNLYFQVFANFILAVLAARWVRREPRWTFAIVGLTALVELPVASRYFQLGATIGGFGSAETYAATWKSLLGSAHRPRALFPSFEVPIEAAGFVGVTWLVLLLLALRRREQWPWLLAAAAALWAAAGRGAGLFDLLAAVPGVGGLRAMGRAQVLFLLFSLPPVLAVLERLRPRWSALALAATMAELLPADLPARVAVDPGLWRGPTPLSAALAPSREPLLVLPEARSRFMLEATQTWTPYFGGYSGRAPAGEELLETVTLRRPWDRATLDDLLDFTRATRVVALDARSASRARASDRLALRGCYAHLHGSTACVFDRIGTPAPPSLRLDRDAVFEQRAGGPWPEADLRAIAAGALEIGQVDRCRLVETLHLPLLPPLRRAVPLQGSALRGIRFQPGALILHQELRQALPRLFAAGIGVDCG